MYNKGRLQPRRKLNGATWNLVVSASRSFAALERRMQLAMRRKRTGRVFPHCFGEAWKRLLLVKEVRATFGVPPGIDSCKTTARRRHGRTASSQATGSQPVGLPPWRALRVQDISRLKQRVRTLASCARFLDSDLKPQGLMRFFG